MVLGCKHVHFHAKKLHPNTGGAYISCNPVDFHSMREQSTAYTHVSSPVQLH